MLHEAGGARRLLGCLYGSLQSYIKNSLRTFDRQSAGLDQLRNQLL